MNINNNIYHDLTYFIPYFDTFTLSYQNMLLSYQTMNNLICRQDNLSSNHMAHTWY